MEPHGPQEYPGGPWEGSSLPGAWPSSALGQAFSQILHQFAGQESRRGKARNAALEDLAALLEAKECDRLFEGSDASLRGMPEMLGQVVKALGKYAAPAEEPEGRGDRHSEVAEKAAAVALLFLKLLRKVEAAKNSLVCPAWKTSLRPLAGPIYVFAVTHSFEQPWTSQRSQEVAGQVLALLLQVTDCGSVSGFLHGENEDEKGRFSAIMGFLKPDLNK